MLKIINIDRHATERAAQTALAAWQKPATKIINFRTGELAPEEVVGFYEALLPRLGTPRYFAEDVRLGDRSRQRSSSALWTEVRYDPAFTDAYRHSANAQPLHTDGSYVAAYTNSTLMACIRNAEAGGETIFIDIPQVIGALSRENPQLLAELMKTSIPHSRSGDARTAKFYYIESGREKVNWNFYCVSPGASGEVKRISKELFDFLRQSPGIKENLLCVKMTTGDAVVWKDNECLHGRNSFAADRPSVRHLAKCSLDFGVFENG